ncbi:GNAT family N-acetyltransferase [Actinomyces oricola]|uniref:GNAT family N-acetyltransferase n=1 Tax=Actinomyces oricola TaxID=206043 RepID=UPI000FFEF8F6|nr:GNAT family N-acetyltransferase [Actinomyces oricola]
MSIFQRRLTPISPRQRDGLLELCAVNPVLGVALAHQVLRWDHWGTGDVVLLGRPGRPRGAAWATGSLMVLGLAPDPHLGTGGAGSAELRALADHAGRRLTRRGSVSGPAPDVAAIWGPLEAQGMLARETRWNQPVLVAPHAPDAGNLASSAVRRRPGLEWVSVCLRAARPEHQELVLPASVAMFIEEVGYDPGTSGGSYARHVSWLIAAGRTYIVLDDGAGGPVRRGSPRAVAFKADVGSLWHSPRGSVAQLTGVWTRPDLRGHGIGSVALAATVDAVRREHVGLQGVVSLYVNDFNAPALGLYSSLGFTQAGTYATILL